MLLFCAQPIKNDNLHDPECTDGDYHFTADIASAKDTVYAGAVYEANAENTGNEKYTRFQIATRPSFLAANSSRIITNDSACTVIFKSVGTCTLYVLARRMNGNEDTVRFPMTVLNPFRIMIDSGSYLQGEAVRFSVKSAVDGLSGGGTSLSVSWNAHSRTNSVSDKKPLSVSDTFYLDTLSLPDTIHVSVVVSDTFGVELYPDSIAVPVLGRFRPYVAITPRILSVPVNSRAPIPVDSCRNADSLVWISRFYGDTMVTAVTRTSRLEYTWPDTVMDTLTVTAKNRFNTIGNSDTVIVNARFFKYGLNLDPDSFPTVIYAAVKAHWRVVATENNVISSDTSINYAWEVDSPYVMFSAKKGALDLLFDHPVPSFHLKVTAYKGTDSSQTYPSVVTVLGHRPSISVMHAGDTVPAGDTMDFLVDANDSAGSGFIGRVDTVFYQRFSEDTSVMIAAGDTVRLRFSEAGRQRVRFWCVDNHHFVSDTAVVSVYVKSLIPHFIDKQVDTFTYAGNPVTIAAVARTERPGDSIVQWRWYADSVSQTPVKVTSVDHFDTVFTDVGTVRLRVLCTSARGDQAQAAALRTIRVSRGLPCVDSMSFGRRDNLYINDTVKFHVAAHDSNGTLALLHVLYNGDSAASFIVNSTSVRVDTVFNLVLPPQPGTYAVSVSAIDNENNVSAAAVLDDSVTVLLGKSRVLGVTPDTCWVNDNDRYRIFAQDDNLPEGRHLTFFVRFTGAETFTALGNDSVFSHAFTGGGVNSFECFAVDDDGVASDTVIETVYVRNGEPHITGIETDTARDRIYVKDPVTFTLTVIDPNDTAVNVRVSWNGDTVPELDQKEKTGTVSFTHAFGNGDTGSVSIRFRVTDQDGMRFDTTFSVQVQSGAPGIDAVTLDTCDGCAFVADNLPFSVAAHDTNGVLRMLYLAWNGGTAADDLIAISGDTRRITSKKRHTYPVSQGGIRTVRAWAVDEDGVRSAVVSQQVAIRYGTPVVTKENVDTFWVRDNNAITVPATDTNGYIVKRWIDWDRNGVWDDSSTSGETFTHAWDTTSGGHAVEYTAKVMDEDSLTGTKDCTAFIRLGRPVLFGADFGDSIQWVKGTGGALDTMFYVYKGNNTYFAVDTTDTNGKCATFYWDFDDDGINQVTVEPTWSQYLGKNTAYRMAAWCKDDDSIQSAKLNFWIYPDEPPPTTTTTTTSQPGMPEVRVSWFELDAKDDSLTQFAVAIDTDQAGAFADTVLNFTEAKNAAIGKSGTLLTYTFNPQNYGINENFYFKVIARDARGSTPAVISPALVQYPYP